MTARGRFITLEGIEGVGKSTLIAALADELRGRGLLCDVTREPGGTPLAETLRELVLTPRDEPVSPATELLMICAARADHVAGKLKPALAAGRWVLCDRYSDATHAYQGGGRGLSREWLQRLEPIAQDGLVPDLTLLLDAPVPLALSRARSRGGATDRFESERSEFFERVRQAYLDRAAAEPQRIVVIDATGGPSRVLAAALESLAPLLQSESR